MANLMIASCLVFSIFNIALTNGQNQFQSNNVPTTSTPPMTTASPEYLACLTRCPSANQYNPVCGTDTISYYNRFRLACAQQCGRNVQVSHIGTCGQATGTQNL